LLNVRDKLDTFENIIKYPILKKITEQQIQDNINYLNAKDESHRWQEFLDFNRKLDSTRNQNLLTAIPEFNPYV
jgi:hypothetical protein